MSALGWDADTRTGRGPGVLMRALGVGVPGVRRVCAQVEPYAAAWRAHNRTAVHGRGRRWIVLGDSLSQGIGASSYDAGWVGQLHARLTADGHDLDVVNLSASGARTPDVLSHQLPVLPALPTPPAGAPPPVVTVLVGSNDLFGGRAARAALPAAMEALVAGIAPGAVVATLPQPLRTARLANRPLVRAAGEGRVRLVDMAAHGPQSWRGLLADDWFHPNDGGHAGIADAVEPVLRRALGDRGQAAG